MPPRRPHTKSRLGCLRCKEKHIKCDEVRPTCGACVRNEFQCVFKVPGGFQLIAPRKKRWEDGTPQRSKSPGVPDWRPSDDGEPTPAISLDISSAASKTSGQSRQSLPPTATSSLSPPVVKPPRESLSTFEFELLHYNIIHVCDTFTPSPAYRLLWSDMAISQAVKYEFLLHLTMMISCLHMALTKSPRFKKTHQEFILSGCSESVIQFQNETRAINESNWRTVGPFTVLISIYALALPLLDDGPKSPGTVIEDMVQVLRLVGGARELSKTQDECKEKHDDNLLEEKDICDPSRVVPIEEFDTDRVLSTLERFIHHSGDDAQIQSINLKAAHALKEASDHNFINMFRPLVWPNLIEKDYLDLVLQRNPASMAILAHFAITLHECSLNWWCAGWGAKLLSAIEYALPIEYKEAIAYPLEKTR